MSYVKKDIFAPLHGGDIQGASDCYGIDIDQWIDLSTGVNPIAYPIPLLPQEVFSRLPYVQDTFVSAAAQYYGSPSLIAVAGSQAAIQLLPMLLHSYPILLPSLGYKEHEKHWRNAGNAIIYYDALDYQNAVETIQNSLLVNPKQHLLIINPNNPTGLCFPIEQLVEWASQLADDAYLVVDEAFMDITPEFSVLKAHLLSSIKDKMIVLKSVGKFFGLAGVRLGFVSAAPSILSAIASVSGDWSINGPAQYIATQAFTDVVWQQTNRQRIQENYLYMSTLLFEVLGAPLSEGAYDQNRLAYLGVSLFISYRLSTQRALCVFDQLAQQGILTRLIKIDDSCMLLRVGLIDCADEAVSARLIKAVASVKNVSQARPLSAALG